MLYYIMFSVLQLTFPSYEQTACLNTNTLIELAYSHRKLCRS